MMSCSRLADNRFARRGLPKAWFRWGAHGLKPTADVHLGVSFTAEMPGSRRVGRFGVPSVHSKFRISTSNHEPAGGVTGHESTDFTSEFLYRCHAFVSSWWVRHHNWNTPLDTVSSRQWSPSAEWMARRDGLCRGSRRGCTLTGFRVARTRRPTRWL